MTRRRKSDQDKSTEGGDSDEQKLIERAKEFWQMNQPADYTYLQPNTPGRQKTQKLFKKWDEQLRKDYDIDTNERQIMAKEKLTVAFRRLIGKLEYQLNKFENMVSVDYNRWLSKHNTELNKDDPDYSKIADYSPHMLWEYMVRDLTKSLAELQDSMAANITIPTVYEESESKAIEHLREKAQKLIDRANEKLHNPKSKKKKQPKK